MCGGYRLTRSQRQLAESFDAYRGRGVPTVQHGPIAAGAIYSAGHLEACPNALDDAMGTRAFRGEGLEHRVPDDQRKSRNSRCYSLLSGNAYEQED